MLKLFRREMLAAVLRSADLEQRNCVALSLDLSDHFLHPSL